MLCPRFHEQMEAEDKELALIGTEIKPWKLNDDDRNIVEPNPRGKTLFKVSTTFDMNRCGWVEC